MRRVIYHSEASVLEAAPWLPVVPYSNNTGDFRYVLRIFATFSTLCWLQGSEWRVANRISFPCIRKFESALTPITVRQWTVTQGVESSMISRQILGIQYTRRVGLRNTSVEPEYNMLFIVS